MNFQEVKINWSKIPNINELELHIQNLIMEGKKYPSGFKFSLPFHFNKEAQLLHEVNKIDELITLYEKNGFSTKYVIEDPFTHEGPTVTCPIGFPFNLPLKYLELKKFNRWICRIHVDIVKNLDNQLISIPHIEPDPFFHPAIHFWDTYLHGNVVRGKSAIEILKFFIE